MLRAITLCVGVLGAVCSWACAGDYSFRVDDSVAGDCARPVQESHNVCTARRVIEDFDQRFKLGKPFQLNASASSFINGNTSFATSRERQEVLQHLADLILYKGLRYESQLLDMINVLGWENRKMVLQAIRKSVLNAGG